jgi:hypothetical protein
MALTMDKVLPSAQFAQAYKYRANSYSEFVDTIDNAFKNDRGYEQTSQVISSSDFVGTRSWDEFIKLSNNGWSEGRIKIERMLRNLESNETFTAIKQDWLYGVAGHTIDIARYCTYEPEQWGTPIEELVEGNGNRIINLYFHTGALATVDMKQMLERGAMLAALVGILENCGFRVCLTMLTCSLDAAGDGKSICTYITIKQAEQPLDLERLAIALHPSTFRRGIFMLYDILSGGPNRSAATKGRTYKHPSIDNEIGAVIVNCDDGYLSSDHQRIKWLKAKIKDVSKSLAEMVNM